MLAASMVKIRGSEKELKRTGTQATKFCMSSLTWIAGKEIEREIKNSLETRHENFKRW